MNDSVNISKKSWHYKLVSSFFDYWEINTICEYWIKVYSLAFGLIVFFLYTSYGYYLLFMVNTVEEYKLSVFGIIALSLSLIVSIVIFFVFCLIFMDYVKGIWNNNKLFKKCKGINFVDGDE